MKTKTHMTPATARRHLFGLADSTWVPTDRAFRAAAKQVLDGDAYDWDARNALDILDRTSGGQSAVLSEVNLFISLLEVVSGETWKSAIAAAA